MGEALHQSSELENNKQLVRNLIEDVLTRHDIGAAEKYFFAQKPIKHNGQVMGTWLYYYYFNSLSVKTAVFPL
jgi:predicted SnoaL-like aldol condensation-catalyzing enzyme